MLAAIFAQAEAASAEQLTRDSAILGEQFFFSARADAHLHRVLRLLRRVPGERVDHVPRLGDRVPPLETHSKTFERVMIGLSILCVIVVLVIVLATNIGDEFRPTV